jgi:hypothetical protein
LENGLDHLSEFPLGAEVFPAGDVVGYVLSQAGALFAVDVIAEDADVSV